MKKKDVVSTVLILFFGIVALVSIFNIGKILISSRKQEAAFKQVEELVAEEEEGTDENGVLLRYSRVFAVNNDLYGWIRVKGTPIDYPVMYTPDDPEYYLRRTFSKEWADKGTPFVDGSCFPGCGNLIIYGHNTSGSTMFGRLSDYKDLSFFEKYPTIDFDTIYEDGEYQIIATFFGRILNQDEEGFRYYYQTDLTDPGVFAAYVKNVKEMSLYDTGVDAEYGDELITLSTCSKHEENGRFVVVAKKIKTD